MGTLHNLNLSPSYVPTWTAWEVVRELVCNALDADPKGMTIEHDGKDIVRVKTTTVPDLAQLFVIGHGTKHAGGDTIGQFGEGSKMAALVATRTEGGSMVFELPDCTVTFLLADTMGTQTLHASVEPAQNGPGFTATVCMPGAVESYECKIEPKRAYGPFEKDPEQQGTKLFVRGVYIATLESNGIWNWNLRDLTTNRDRAMVSEFNARWAMGQWFGSNMTSMHADAIMAHDGGDALEINSLGYQQTAQSHSVMKQAFLRRFGNNAVLPDSNQEVNRMATKAGYFVAFSVPHSLRDVLASCGVPNADSVTEQKHDLQPVADQSAYNERLRFLGDLHQYVDLPSVQVVVYETRDDNLKSSFTGKDQEFPTIWLAEDLVKAGDTVEIMGQYLIQMNLLLSYSKGSKLRSLSDVAAQLACQLLNEF